MDKGKILKNLKKDKDLGKHISFAVTAPQVNFVSTGNLALNWCLSNQLDGGFPVGRVVEVFGEPSTGKSLLLYHVLAECQKAGGISMLDDTESCFSPDFMRMLGVDPDELIIVPSINEDGQKTFEDHMKFVVSAGKKIREAGFEGPITAGLDSLAAISTRHELETEGEKPDVARAKQLRAYFRVYSPVLHKLQILYIMNNHIISTLATTRYQKQTTTPGGGGPKFWSSVRLSLKNKDKIKDDKNNVFGENILCKVEKTKMTSPFRECLITVRYDEGLERTSGLFDVFLKTGKIECPTPGYYYYGDNKDKKLRRSVVEELIAAEYEGGENVVRDGTAERAGDEGEGGSEAAGGKGA